jgi:electron transport complex protein RnfB
MVDALTILYSALILLALAGLFSVLLAELGKKLAVKQDERIDKVKKLLSGANCGGCGFAGCEAYAKALVEGTASLSACNATATENKQKIAEILGVEDKSELTVPVVCCVGGNNAVDKYAYMGYGDCRSMELLAGGRKLCKWGCLGTGSCVDACPEHAIEVGQDGYSCIDHSMCVGCGMCVQTCPKKIIKRVPITAKVYIACSNCVKGKEVRTFCKRGCIACGICVKSCPEGAIELVGNLPVIDYKKCTGCKTCVAKCPSKCISELDVESGSQNK